MKGQWIGILKFFIFAFVFSRFHKLAWGACGLGSDNADGIIVGGCDDGRVQMYNVSKLLKGENSIIARQDKHSGAVRAIEFNSFQVSSVLNKQTWIGNLDNNFLHFC